MDLLETDILGDEIGNHWYYAAKASSLGRVIDGIDASTALDVGAGSGFFAEELLRRTRVHTVDCVDTAFEADRVDTGPHGTVRRFRALDDATVEADVALLMDVLEHVEDDVGLAADTAAHVRPGGHLFVTVPAFQSLWSDHDVFLGHVRRYRLPEVEAVLRRAELQVVRGFYFYGAVLPLAAATRLASRSRASDGAEPKSSLRTHSRPVNAALRAVCRAETRIQERNRIAGLTAAVLARRP